MAWMRPQNMDKSEFTKGFASGNNKVNIVSVKTVDGERLERLMNYKRKDLNDYSIKNPDINIAIEIAPEDTERRKEFIMVIVFKRNAQGLIDMENENTMKALRSFYKTMSLLFPKDIVGINEKGLVVDEHDKPVLNFPSFLDAYLKSTDFRYLAYLVKNANGYLDVKALGFALNKECEERYQKEMDRLDKSRVDAGNATSETEATSFDYGNNNTSGGLLL